MIREMVRLEKSLKNTDLVDDSGKDYDRGLCLYRCNSTHETST